MRAVALVMCLVFTACFPNNARHRTYAKLTEGGFLLGGIVLLGFSSTQADCDMDVKLGMPKSDCKSKAGLISGIGLTMVLLGMIGFAATQTTADDSKQTTPPTPPTTPTPPATPPTTPPTPPTTPAPAS
jgi:hypothetical protein